MSELYVLVAAVLAIDTALLAVLVWAYHAPRLAAHRLGGGPPMRLPWQHRLRTMTITSTLSLVTVIGVTYLLRDQLLHDGPVAPWTIPAQAAGILVIYDFAYYFLHRAMHQVAVLRPVHGVHHRARNPSALESFYQHPAELLAGLALLFASTWVIGPVHVHAFALTFLVYSTLNIVVHAGMVSRVGALAPIDFLIRKHHAHHAGDPHANYSTMTPLPDWLFGTAHRGSDRP